MESAAEELGIAFQFGSFFKMYKDGTVERGGRDVVAASPVATRDVRIENEEDVGQQLQWARIFLPPPPLEEKRLPVVLFFHGGGCLFGSPDWSNFHDLCSTMAARSRSIWVSASYRLAPEHPFPAPIHDCMSALAWLPSSTDPWLTSFADLSQFFLCGESAGGNLAHHVALNWDPCASNGITLRGLILLHPGFLRGGKDCRTPQELACPQDELMNWDAADACLHLVLPPGSPSTSTPYLNPLLAFQQKSAASFRYAPYTLVALADHDALHFFALEYIEALRRAGHHVETIMSHGVGHVFYIAQPESAQAEALIQRVADFIQHHRSGGGGA